MATTFSTGDWVGWSKEAPHQSVIGLIRQEYGDGPFEVIKVIRKQDVWDMRELFFGADELLELRSPDSGVLRRPNAPINTKFNDFWLVVVDPPPKRTRK